MKLSKSSSGIALVTTICLLAIIGFAGRYWIQAPPQPINVLAATNLDQCTVAIKGLQKLGGYKDKYGQHWLVEQHPWRIGLPVILSEAGNTVQYGATLISVDCDNRDETNHVSKIQTQTPNMNIDETRKLGLQLCSVLKIAPKGFSTWCDNGDGSLYDSTAFRDFKSGKLIAFQTLRTYNSKKPWFINVIIEDIDLRIKDH